MSRALRGGDWIAVAAEQAQACRLLHGGQSFGVSSIPFTPGTFALETFRFWNSSAKQALAAAVLEGKLSPLAFGLTDNADALALIGVPVPPGTSLFVTDAPRLAAGFPGTSVAVKQACVRVDTALRTLLDAMAKGSTPGTRNGAGLLCLDSTQAARFWGAVAGLGREYSFLGAATSIPIEQYWTVIKEGAKEGLRNVGEAAGAALDAAGDGIGTALGGFFKGLGVVNTVVLAGGGFLIARKVF